MLTVVPIRQLLLRLTDKMTKNAVVGKGSKIFYGHS
jgi:hypothetical protein